MFMAILRSKPVQLRWSLLHMSRCLELPLDLLLCPVELALPVEVKLGAALALADVALSVFIGVHAIGAKPCAVWTCEASTWPISACGAWQAIFNHSSTIGVSVSSSRAWCTLRCCSKFIWISIWPSWTAVTPVVFAVHSSRTFRSVHLYAVFMPIWRSKRLNASVHTPRKNNTQGKKEIG